MQYNIYALLDPVVNFGKATVSTGYSNLATTIILTTGEGSKLPDPTTDGSFNLVWFNNTDYADPADDPNVEIVRCISRVTDTIVLMRGQEGTPPTNKNIPGKIYKIILSQTKKTIGDIQTDAQSRVDTHSALVTGIHGVGTDTVDGISARNTAISTHSAVTSSVHNFDAFGNSPPQTHGKIKHDITTVDGGASLGSAIQIPLHDSSRHTGTIGAWTQIDKTTSDIADITTKSHTSLTDIGTNTHSQIDTHISAIMAHGVSAGLDASKPALPVVGQRYLAVDTNKDYECYANNVWTDITATHAALTANVHNFDASGNAPPQLHGLASHTGTIGDHQGNLSGIGTKTHSDIDAHIASNASVHNFDSSGNAPPALHAKAKHDSSTVDGGAALSSVTQIPAHGSAQHTDIIGTESEITFASTGGHVHDGISSTRVPWTNIDKTTSNIADITTKSHISLTDIGINTHSQIDTHISSNTNVHGISAGLDASKPASPLVGQRYLATDTNKDYECYVAGTWRDVTATHAALTASVHGFDASGNAPPKLHGLASHTGIIGDHQGNLTGIGTNTHAQIDTHIGASTAHGTTGTIIGTTDIQTLTNKTITDSSNNVMAKSLKSATTTIDVSASTAPSSGQILTATGSTAATWQTPATIPSPASAVVSETAFNQSSAVGTSTLYARSDHTHGTPSNAGIVTTASAISGQYASLKYTTTVSLDWNNGNVQYIVLGNGGQTFTFANPRDGGRYMLILKQPASSAAGTVTWPASVLWSGGTAPTLTTTNGKVDIMTFAYDGTNSKYYGGSSLNY